MGGIVRGELSYLVTSWLNSAQGWQAEKIILKMTEDMKADEEVAQDLAEYYNKDIKTSIATHLSSDKQFIIKPV